MAGETTEAIVGGAVLAAAAGFVLYAAQATGLGGGGQETYHLTASFRSLEGVTLGTDVRLAGVKVGTVAGIDLNVDTYRAETRLSLRDSIQVPDDSAAVVSSEGLLGGNYVEIVPGGSPFYFAPGDEIIDTQGAVSLISLLLKYVGGGSD